MKEILFWVLGRSFSVTILLAAALFLRKWLGNRYEAYVWRYLWIGLCLFILLPIQIPGMIRWNFSPDQWKIKNAIKEEKNLSFYKGTKEKKKEFSDGNYEIELRNDVIRAAEQEKAAKTKEEIRREIKQSILVNHPVILDWWQLGGLIWLSGFLLTGSCSIFRYGFWKVQIKKGNRNIAEAEYRELLWEEAKKLKIPVPELYENSKVRTPLLMGLFHPVILIPDRKISTQQARLIFRHECIHQKKKDIGVQYLWNVACMFYRFHPLVWLGKKQMLKDLEIACDQAVLEGSSKGERLAYGEAMLFFFEKSNKKYKNRGGSLFSGEKADGRTIWKNFFHRDQKERQNLFKCVSSCSSFVYESDWM